jgi:hypothetical protein
VEDAHSDFEDFFELASTLVSAIDYGPCWLINGLGLNLEPLRDAPDAPNPDLPICVLGAYKNVLLPDNTDKIIRTGMSANGTAWPVLVDIDLARKYPFSPTFNKHARRWSVIAGLESEAYDDGASTRKYDRSVYPEEKGEHANPSAAEVMSAQSSEADKVFIKINKNKYFAGNVQLRQAMTIEQANSALMDALEYGMVHLAGYSDIVQVQESVVMEYEYRIIMIDGKPVTGAGCVEEFTPLDNTSNFDTRVRQIRDSRTSIVEMPDGLIEKYLELARKFADDIYAESGLKNYVLDVCLIKGQPAVIELNSCYNFGLYACDVHALVREITKYAENNVQAAHAPELNSLCVSRGEDAGDEVDVILEDRYTFGHLI